MSARDGKPMPSRFPFSLALLTVAALGGSGCGDAGNQAAPTAAETQREEEQIRKNQERIKVLLEENEALRRQLQTTPPPAAPAPAPEKP